MQGYYIKIYYIIRCYLLYLVLAKIRNLRTRIEDGMEKARILVVDDESDILELLRYNLEREGYPVVCVASGEAALQEIERFPPDLIILDLMLPGLDGLEVCKIVKNNTLF